LSQKVVIVMFI